MKACDLDLTASDKNEVKIRNYSSVTKMAKHIWFESKNLIRFITKEGIDLLYNIQLKRIVVFSRHDNWDTIRHGTMNSRHHILDPAAITPKDTLARLIRRCS